MFTVFSVPKPFIGHVGVIQENAISRWTRLGAVREVILFGAEHGTAEVADRFRIRHEPQLRRNEYGTPLVSDLFERAQRLATHDWLCYVNCDVLLTGDLSRAVRAASELGQPVLVTGRRWRLDIERPLDLEPAWGKVGIRNSPEAARNRRLAGAQKSTLDDATHKLTDPGPTRAIDRVRLRYWLYALRGTRFVGRPVRMLLKWGFAAEPRGSW